MRQTYVAVKGDTLLTISQRFYGDTDDHHVALIAAASGVHSPDDVQPGQIIVIP